MNDTQIAARLTEINAALKASKASEWPRLNNEAADLMMRVVNRGGRVIVDRATGIVTIEL